MNGQYHLDYFHLPSNEKAKSTHFAVLAKGDIIHATLNVSEGDSEIHKFLPHMTPTSKQISEIQKLRRYEEDIHRSESMKVPRTVLERYDFQRTYRKNVRNWFNGLASRIFCGDEWEDFFESHGRSGLFDIFCRDVDLMRNVAEYSLRASHPESSMRIAEMFGRPNEQRSFDEALAKAEKAWNAVFRFRKDGVDMSFI